MKKTCILLTAALICGTMAGSMLIGEEETSNPFSDQTVTVKEATKDEGTNTAEVKAEEKKDDSKKDEAKADEKKDDSKKDEEKKDDSKKEEKSSTYTVVSGDYLISIAERIYGDGSRWHEIVDANSDKYPSLLTNPNLIYPGWEFTLPGADSAKVAAASKGNASSGTATSGKADIVGTAMDDSGWGTVAPCTPLPNRLSSPFGYRTHPVTGQKSSFHNAVDIPVPTGTRVNALANGVVTAVGWESTGGNYVKVKYDNGLETFCCHLKNATVKVGQKVTPGDQIAVSDNTGAYTTGAHLHFGVKRNGQWIDPCSVLKLPKY